MMTKWLLPWEKDVTIDNNTMIRRVFNKLPIYSCAMARTLVPFRYALVIWDNHIPIKTHGFWAINENHAIKKADVILSNIGYTLLIKDRVEKLRLLL